MATTKVPFAIEPDTSDEMALYELEMVEAAADAVLGTETTREIEDRPETSSLATKLTLTVTAPELVLKTNGVRETFLKEGGEMSDNPTWLKPKGTPLAGTGAGDTRSELISLSAVIMATQPA
jgi:hypothetical protein